VFFKKEAFDMKVQKKKDLGNSTEFAAKCGISVHTISDWVTRGKIKPEVEAGGRYYFGHDSYTQVQALLLKSKNPVSYLVVLVADNEDALAEKRAAWNELKKEVLPRGEQITSLKEFLCAIDKAQPDVDNAVSQKVMDSLASAATYDFQDSIFKRIRDICNECEKAMELPTRFFISMMLGEETSAEDLEQYNSLSLGISFTPTWQLDHCKEEFRRIMTRYGYMSAIRQKQLSMGDIFRSGVSLLADTSLPMDFSQSAFKSNYDKEVARVRGKAKKLLVAQVASKGYFTVIEAVGSLTEEQEDFITNAVLDGDYTSIYFSSRNVVSEEALRSIGIAVRVNKLEFTIADEVEV